MPFVSHEGVRLYYEDVGQGEPLVLVAGQQIDHTFWKYIRDDYAHHFRTISFDYRGTGLSDAPKEPPYSMELFCGDIVALLDHLHIQRAHFFGVSMGGRVLQRLALLYPSRVGALILGATFPGNKHGVRRDASVDALLQRPQGDADRRLAINDLMHSREWGAAHPAYFASLVRPPITREAQALHFRASEAHEAWDELPLIKAPVLVMHGDSDRINPSANSILIAQRLPNARLCWIVGGRHGFYAEFKEETLAAVRGFLAQHPLPRARL